MNISLNWLKDYLKIDLTPDELASALTSIGLETGGIKEIESIKGGLQGLVIGKILTCEHHPNSDHLHITTVDTGMDEMLQIVCGASNVAAGQTVIVATNGTVLYSGEKSFTIKKSTIRGVESNGMICAEDEIGIGTSHEGIIVLPENTEVGTPAKEYYQVESDYLLEVDITPNRIDAASHFGIARDLAAFLQQNGKTVTLQRPSVETFKVKVEDRSPAIQVVVENTEACPRYSGLSIKNIQVKESPNWLKNRLKIIGLRPINNIVDVTNYVLHELGQALHAFDLKEIRGNKIIVKTLPEGTSFTTLDGIERKLSSEDLMICNEQGGMCIGGVFGGLTSGVTETTTDIFLESAYFHPTWIRKTARRHGLNTDASFRFERGCDPNNTIYVLKRAALLIQEVAGGSICGEIQDAYSKPIENAKISLSLEKVNKLIGKKIPTETIRKILKSLEIEIIREGTECLELSIPTYRVDVLRDVDVIEDILRIYGYNNVETGEGLKSNLSYQTPSDKSYAMQNLISEQLVGSGFNEILNNSLTSGTYYDTSDTFPKKQCVVLKNPLSTELNVMRQTLLFGGLESIEYNQNRKNPDLKLFEFGNIYTYNAAKYKEDSKLAAIKEEFHLALWLTGNKISNSWIHPEEKSSVYELKAYVENVLIRLGINPQKLAYKPLSEGLYSSGLSLTSVSGRVLGTLGILQKKIGKQFDISSEVYFAELNWDALMKETQKHQVSSVEIAKFPPVKRDLALLVDKQVTFAAIEKVAFEADRRILKEVSLFDVYEGKNLPEGKKSYAVSFTLQDEEKTLNDKQIESIMKKIQNNLEQKLGSSLR